MNINNFSHVRKLVNRVSNKEIRQNLNITDISFLNPSTSTYSYRQKKILFDTIYFSIPNVKNIVIGQIKNPDKFKVEDDDVLSLANTYKRNKYHHFHNNIKKVSLYVTQTHANKHIHIMYYINPSRVCATSNEQYPVVNLYENMENHTLRHNIHYCYHHHNSMQLQTYKNLIEYCILYNIPLKNLSFNLTNDPDVQSEIISFLLENGVRNFNLTNISDNSNSKNDILTHSTFFEIVKDKYDLII